MKYLPLVFLTSFFVVLFTTPSLIRVAFLKRLFDEPGEERKLHNRRIPTIGGIIIFAATLFSFSLWFPPVPVAQYKYIIATMLILFFVGVKDDIIGTAAVKKLMAHILVGLILVLMADMRITNMHGLFGINQLPIWASVFLSLFTYVVIVNSFNLIDGVDGLASGIGLIASLSYGIWFFLAGDPVMATLSFSLAGSLMAFLIFNFNPAKIFMGDSGSLTIGLIIAILTINLIEYDVQKISIELAKNMLEFDVTVIKHEHLKISRPIFAIAVLIYPLYDTLRIFIFRSIKGVSPFSADKKHIHHKLIKIGLNHRSTVLTLYSANILIILFSVFLKDLNPTYAFLTIGFSTLLIAQVPFFFKNNLDQPRKTMTPILTKMDVKSVS